MESMSSASIPVRTQIQGFALVAGATTVEGYRYQPEGDMADNPSGFRFRGTALV
jgi:hypothetical protein